MTRVSIRAKYSLKGFIGSKQKLDGHVNVGITEIEPVVQPLTISENGTYTSPDDVDGYNPITVDIEPVIQPLSISGNGTYTASDGVDGYSPVTVDVPGAIEPPLIGFVPNAWDSFGYITGGVWYGTYVSDYVFSCNNGSRPFKMSDIVFNDNITSIGEYTFNNCSKLALTTLPDSLTSIGNFAFAYCSNLALTSLPPGLTHIGYYTFRYCSSLAITYIPTSIVDIQSEGFGGCTNLTTITFEGTPKIITSTTFKNCTNLTTINVPWSEGAVANAPWGATNATINYNYKGE